MLKQTIEALILRECRLLDQGLLDEWLQMYTQDAIYWLPIDENADPLSDSSIIYDNRLRLEVRVEQFVRQKRVSQAPGSQSMRMVSNLDVEAQGENQARARFSMLVLEVRSGDWRQQGLGEMQMFPGHCTLDLRREDGQWRIAGKTFVLLNRKQPIVGLSFIL